MIIGKEETFDTVLSGLRIRAKKDNITCVLHLIEDKYSVETADKIILEHYEGFIDVLGVWDGDEDLICQAIEGTELFDHLHAQYVGLEVSWAG